VPRPMKVLLLPETEHMIATEHRIPEDGYDHKILRCPCEPDYHRIGNKVIVSHVEVVDAKTR
jgi:hypothetical protein